MNHLRFKLREFTGSGVAEGFDPVSSADCHKRVDGHLGDTHRVNSERLNLRRELSRLCVRHIGWLIGHLDLAWDNGAESEVVNLLTHKDLLPNPFVVGDAPLPRSAFSGDPTGIRDAPTRCTFKLDGKIDAAFFESKASELRREQAASRRSIESHERANQSYLNEGVKLLELANVSHELFAKQVPREKRRLLDFVLSNCPWKDGALTPA